MGERSCASSTITCPYDRGAPDEECPRLVEQRHVLIAPAQLGHAARTIAEQELPLFGVEHAV